MCFEQYKFLGVTLFIEICRRLAVRGIHVKLNIFVSVWGIFVPRKVIRGRV